MSGLEVQANALHVSGDHLFLAHPEGHHLEVVDISDPTNPSLVAEADDGDAGTTGALDALPVGEHVYVPAGASSNTPLIARK